jgi:hypothetical protein
LRRSLIGLEAAVKRASTARERAVALYQLALFHDNNSREVLAIPHYQKALRAGLQNEQRAQALAWLASSLYKTDQPRKALSRLHQARAVAKGRALRKFLDGLEARINR